MAEFPPRIQDKISTYIGVLNSRFPSSKIYYRISIGYPSSAEALNDTRAKNIIYTNDDSEPVLSSTIYIDQSKKDLFDGKSLYYHVFDSTEVSLIKAIQINNKGVVINIVTPK